MIKQLCQHIYFVLTPALVCALHHWDNLLKKKSTGNALFFFSIFRNDTQQVALKNCENNINNELTHIDKTFFRANRQIYRYTIHCPIPNIIKHSGLGPFYVSSNIQLTWTLSLDLDHLDTRGLY